MIHIPVKLTAQGHKTKVQIPSLAMTFLVAKAASVEGTILRRVADAAGKFPVACELKRVTSGTYHLRSQDHGGLLALMMRQQRAARGYTIQEMARDMGMRNWSAYHTYEQPNINPTITTLSRLIGHFKGCEMTVGQ